jgi:hypothetical protein
MVEIERKDDSWQKPACAHSAHRRESFHSVDANAIDLNFDPFDGADDDNTWLEGS